MLTIEEQLSELNQREKDKILEAAAIEEMYIPKIFEILEWEIREVEADEWIKCKRDPRSFPESVQRKYFWRSEKDWEFPVSVDPEWEIPEWYMLDAWIIMNPYTKEERAIYEHKEILKRLREVVLDNLKTWSNDLEWYEFSDIEIGDVITARVFGGNPYAQMVLQAKATEAMFRVFAWKGTPEDKEILEKKDIIMGSVNEVRSIFSLSPM